MTQLYRHYDKDGQLLYVGISNVFTERTKTHRRVREWFLCVERINLQHFHSRAEAEAAETKAIREEKPLYNKTHKGEDKELRHFEKLRQQFIADHLKKHGVINRADIMEAFDVSTPTASLDLSKFRKANPKAIVYNYQLKQWEKR